jgi:hypothetical protein
VVRYVLNRAGLLGGDSVHADTELVFGFGLNALPEGADPQNILFLPPIDTAIFNNLDNPFDTRRSGPCSTRAGIRRPWPSTPAGRRSDPDHLQLARKP